MALHKFASQWLFLSFWRGIEQFLASKKLQEKNFKQVGMVSNDNFSHAHGHPTTAISRTAPVEDRAPDTKLSVIERVDRMLTFSQIYHNKFLFKCTLYTTSSV